MHHGPRGRGESKPLLAIKVQKRISFMSTCHRPNGKKKKKKHICFYPITHLGYSDGGWILDQNQKKKSYKKLNFPVTGNP